MTETETEKEKETGTDRDRKSLGMKSLFSIWQRFVSIFPATHCSVTMSGKSNSFSIVHYSGKEILAVQAKKKLMHFLLGSRKNYIKSAALK